MLGVILMGVLDVAGNVVTLGVSYRITKDLLGSSSRKRKKKRKN